MNFTMPQNSSKKRYRVRYDRLIFVAAILLVLILILSSCISSCTKKKNPSSPSDSNSSASNATDSSGSTGNSGSNANSAAASPTEPLNINYATTELEYEDIYKGDLILANQAHPCKFDFNAISQGTSDEVEMTTIKSILDTKTGEYLHYTAADWEVGMDKEAALAMDAWLEGFYDVSHDSDVRMIGGYRSDADDQDFRTGRTCTIGIFPTEGSSYVYQYSETYGWIQDNAQNYGFILRYPEGKESYFDDSITSRTSGTFRYVGVGPAAYITQNNLCLEEFLETVKTYTIDNMLKVSCNGASYGMYYVPATPNGKTSLSVPSSGTPYTISGNNMDGFIVTVTLSGASEAPIQSETAPEPTSAE